MSFRIPFSAFGVLLTTLLAPGAVAGESAPVAPKSVGDAALFERLDADKDGAIAAGEVSAEHKTLFARLLRRADDDKSQSLSHEEFLAGLVPTRPEKPIESKQPATVPQADAVKYLLLAMDTSRNSMIEADEVPDDLRQVYEILAERADRNDNDRIERQELDRAGPVLSMVAGRYVQREGIDATTALKKLEKSQGDDAGRFERPPISFEQLRDPKQARRVFAQLDANSNGQIERNEIPPPLEQPLERFSRLADRDRDGKLSEREFLVGAERVARYMGGGLPERMRDRDKKRDRDTEATKKNRDK
jgi:Ca2+-binding EF-hand superfamily protein